jgi:ubiquinone/menaquinone biosynthesis C-methylase UbiE
MPEKVDLYSAAYLNYEADVYRQVRAETYGADLGQTSWVTTDESHEIPELLKLEPNCSVLEIGCGSGRYALQVAESTGCRILGLDINGPGISNANQLALTRNMASQVRFELCDVSQRLACADETFDAVFSNDALCHVSGRLNLLQELFRVLKPGGRILFSDALVIGGTISHQEIATRSLIGYYIFSPPGENERLLQQVGFFVVNVNDTTDNAARIAQRWHQAREIRRAELIAVEGAANFDGQQQFLSCVHSLTREKRLLRYLYVAQKPGA